MPGLASNWYFVLPNVYGETKDGKPFSGLAIQLNHGVAIQWDGRLLRHCTSVLRNDGDDSPGNLDKKPAQVGNQVYGMFSAAKSKLVDYARASAARGSTPVEHLAANSASAVSGVAAVGGNNSVPVMEEKNLTAASDVRDRGPPKTTMLDSVAIPRRVLKVHGAASWTAVDVNSKAEDDHNKKKYRARTVDPAATVEVVGMMTVPPFIYKHENNLVDDCCVGVSTGTVGKHHHPLHRWDDFQRYGSYGPAAGGHHQFGSPVGSPVAGTVGKHGHRLGPRQHQHVSRRYESYGPAGARRYESYGPAGARRLGSLVSTGTVGKRHQPLHHWDDFQRYESYGPAAAQR